MSVSGVDTGRLRELAEDRLAQAQRYNVEPRPVFVPSQTVLALLDELDRTQAVVEAARAKCAEHLAARAKAVERRNKSGSGMGASNETMFIEALDEQMRTDPLFAALAALEPVQEEGTP